MRCQHSCIARRLRCTAVASPIDCHAIIVVSLPSIGVAVFATIVSFGSVPVVPSFFTNDFVCRSTRIIGPYSAFPHNFPASSSEAMRASSKTRCAGAMERAAARNAAAIMSLRRRRSRGGNAR